MRFVKIGDGTRAISLDLVAEVKLVENRIYIYMKEGDPEGYLNEHRRNIWYTSNGQAQEAFDKIVKEAN